MVETFATYICCYCLQSNEVFVDITEGSKQTIVEDCHVCCRPNLIHIRVDEDTDEVTAEAELEG